jgi:hypothetical protein
MERGLQVESNVSSYFLRISRIAVISSVFLLLTGFALAQSTSSLPSDPNIDNGTHSYGTYDGVHDNVSLASGNLSFCIPLFSLPGRNKHTLSVPLCYNSQFQELTSPTAANIVPAPVDALAWFPWVWGTSTPAMGPGWALIGQPAIYGSTSTTVNGYPVGFMPDGSRISFPGSGEIGPDGQNADIFRYNSGMLLKDGTLTQSTCTNTTSDGFCAAASSTITKTFPDGNAIIFGNNSITDTIGRTVNVAFNAPTSTTATLQFQYPDSNGVTRATTVQMATMQFS